MRIVCLSDTHKRHKDVCVPDGDVLIFAGDMCGGGSEKSARKFTRWFASHPHRHKVMIAGNHDRCFENGARLIIKSFVKENGITYLEHEPENIDGVKFFGSPYQPSFCNWAFNVDRGPDLARKWRQIPDNTEVLITHGPPHGILDVNDIGEHCGCEELRKRIEELPNLKAHVFGHIHYSYAIKALNGVAYVNACTCGENYKPINEPLEIDI